MGQTPTVYHSNDNGASSNAECVEVDNDNDNNNEDGSTSSLGCDSSGNYVICLFSGNSCDGNYFLSNLDTFDTYNDQYANIGCVGVDNINTDALYTLLSNSWTCDIRLYPNSCPDPYGKKSQYDFALRTASHGGNAMLAYNNMEWKRPLRIFSWILMILSGVMLGVMYYITKRGRSPLIKMNEEEEEEEEKGDEVRKQKYVSPLRGDSGKKKSFRKSKSEEADSSNVNGIEMTARDGVSNKTLLSTSSMPTSQATSAINVTDRPIFDASSTVSSVPSIVTDRPSSPPPPTTSYSNTKKRHALSPKRFRNILGWSRRKGDM